MKLVINSVIQPFSLTLLTEAGRFYEACLSDGMIAETIVEKLHALCDETNCSLNQLSHLIHINGPGPYTSLRVGVCVVKTIAQLYDIPIISISSLKTLISPTLPQGALLLSLMPARKGEVNLQLFSIQDSLLTEISECMLLSIDELTVFCSQFKEQVYVVLPKLLESNVNLELPMVRCHVSSLDPRLLLEEPSFYNEDTLNWRDLSVTYSPIPVVS